MPTRPTALFASPRWGEAGGRAQRGRRVGGLEPNLGDYSIRQQAVAPLGDSRYRSKMHTEPLVVSDAIQMVQDAIRAFPARREVTHCGVGFTASPFAIYATCPACLARVKLRAYSAAPEIEDVFDAVFEWMTQHGAGAAADARMAELAAEEE